MSGFFADAAGLDAAGGDEAAALPETSALALALSAGMLIEFSADNAAVLPRFNDGAFGSAAGSVFSEVAEASVEVVEEGGAGTGAVGLFSAVAVAGCVVEVAGCGAVEGEEVVEEEDGADVDAAGGAAGALGSVFFAASLRNNLGGASVSSNPRGTEDAGFFTFFAAISLSVSHLPSLSQVLFGPESAVVSVNSPCETPS